MDLRHQSLVLDFRLHIERMAKGTGTAVDAVYRWYVQISAAIDSQVLFRAGEIRQS